MEPVTTTATPADMAIVAGFANFLSWGEQPNVPERRNVPPAWWAYAFGATKHCPPVGEW